MENLLFNSAGNDFQKLNEFKNFNTNKSGTGLLSLFDPQDDVIYELSKIQKSRFWRADEYPIDRIKEGIDELDSNDRSIFEYTLSFLTFLDSVQVGNITNLEIFYNLPEYKVWGATHKFFEVEHSIAYSNILKGLFPEEKRINIFYHAIKHSELRYRNELIAKNYQKLQDLILNGINKISKKEYAITLWIAYISMYIMESVTFYLGFKIMEFYQYKYGILPMVNKMISEIKADELFHTKVASVIIKKLRKLINQLGIDNNQLDDYVYNIFTAFVESDIQFYKSILSKNNFGITDTQIGTYIKYLADLRLKLIGLKPINNIKENPFKDIDDLYGFIESHATTGRKDSFFETRSTAYISKDLNDHLIEDFKF